MLYFTIFKLSNKEHNYFLMKPQDNWAVKCMNYSLSTHEIQFTKQKAQVRPVEGGCKC